MTKPVVASHLTPCLSAYFPTKGPVKDGIVTAKKINPAPMEFQPQSSLTYKGKIESKEVSSAAEMKQPNKAASSLYDASSEKTLGSLRRSCVTAGVSISGV